MQNQAIGGSMLSITTEDEIKREFRLARCRAARKGWETRRERAELEKLYALVDPRHV